ncbi:MAG: hypothetical protein E6672_07120 [Negativicoccus succinicivorans]|nr:hypothetical protein [Negativicoccus succinicivorans]
MLNESDIIGADELLSPNVDADIIEKAEKWLYYFASRRGVAVDDLRPSFIVQELGTAYALREVCRKKAFSASAGAWAGQDNAGDFYAQKLAFYEKRVAELEKRITAADLTDNARDFIGYRTTQLVRG